MEHCCKQFAEQVREQQIEPDSDGVTWNINGCCGGGCYVVTDVRFCPFCGAQLAHPLTQDSAVS